MSLIVSGNKIIQSKSIGYELIDDPALEVIYTLENWARPSDWISVPTPAIGSEVVNILYGVHEDGPNFLSIQATGTFSVNWGDGSSQSVYSNSYVRKELLFGSYSSGTITSDGFRQALITVTPNTPGTFLNFNLNNRHAYQSTNNSYRPSILEIKMSGPNLQSIGSFTQFDRLASFEFVGTHSITNLSSIFNSGNSGLIKFKMDCLGVTNTTSMFNSCVNLREVDISNLQSSTNMSSMFSACRSLNTLPVIDAATCLNMGSMFNGCHNLEDSPVLINTSLVNNTSYMFANCTLLKRVISFTCSNVTDMSYMFHNCYLLQTIPLLDTAKVSNFNYTFGSNTGYPMQLQFIPSLNTASASNMSYMFNNCRSLTSDRRTKGISFLNTANVTDMSYMFQNCVKVKTIPQFNTQSVKNFRNMFSGCILLSEVPLLNTATASNMQSMFDSCRVLQTVPLFNTQNVTTFEGMFRYCFELNEVPSFNMATASNVSYMFDCLTTTDTPNGSLYTIPNFNFSSTIASINMLNFLSGQGDLVYIPQLNTSRVTNMSTMFNGCREIKEVPTLNMSQVVTTYFMFRGCTNLRKVGALNMPLNTDMRYMFLNCYNLQYIESIFTTTALTNVRQAFQSCFKITQIPAFNTSAVATADNGFYYMFESCYSLVYAPALNTANVRTFYGTFANCHSLVAAPNFNTSLATDMTYMYQNCYSLEHVPSYNISNVTSLYLAFNNCHNLISITFSNISTTTNVNLYQAFEGCSRLRSVSMPGIRISSPVRTFWGCTSLRNVGTFSVVSAGGVGGGGGYYGMFTGCSQLVDLSGLTFDANAAEFREMFNGCTSLKETPNFSMTASGDPSYQTGVFSGCSNLSKVNIPSFRFSMSFQGCNLDYNSINTIIDNFQLVNMASNFPQTTYRVLNFLDNPGLPEMMNFYNRKKVYDKGYTFSTGTYNWKDLRHYVDAGSTYSYSGVGTTFSDVSGFTFNANLSPTFSSVSTSTTDGTLINSPVFSTNNFTFNGTDQVVLFGTSSETMLSTITIFAVIEPISLPVGATVSIIGRYDSVGRDNYFLDFTDQKLRFGFRQSGTATRVQRVLNKTFNTGQKYFIVAKYQSNSNGSCVIWVDGVKELSYFSDNITNQIMDQVSTSILSMGGNYAANISYANIKVYNAGIYNRLLEDWQVEELYDFFKKKNIL